MTRWSEWQERRARVLFSAVALVGSSACGSATEPWGDLATETSAVEYDLGDRGARVPFTIRNLSASTAYYVLIDASTPCVVLDRWTNTAWRQEQELNCQQVIVGLTELAPGQSLPGVVTLREAGTFRLRLAVGTTSLSTPDWSEPSNSFLVR